jgi:lysyl-tRNA synthetase, class I
LRKVPDNVPNRDQLARHLGLPLTRIPDPFGKFESFGHHNNAMLRDFLDRFGFDYEFASSSDYYASGRFDAALLRMLECYDEVMAIMLPSLREERAQDLFALPAAASRDRHRHAGADRGAPRRRRHHRLARSRDGQALRDAGDRRRLQAAVEARLGHALVCARRRLRDVGQGSHRFGEALPTRSAGCSAAEPPDGFNYELFLDETGQKISKSKGNGLTIEEWLTYASPESLQLFMYHKPREAKRLYFDVIPRAVDEYYAQLAGYWRQEPPSACPTRCGTSMAANRPGRDAGELCAAAQPRHGCQCRDQGRAVGLPQALRAEVSPESHPELDRLLGYALALLPGFRQAAQALPLG